jgi:hypothetical protein
LNIGANARTDEQGATVKLMLPYSVSNSSEVNYTAAVVVEGGGAGTKSAGGTGGAVTLFTDLQNDV